MSGQEALSAEEFRARLYHRLRDKGLVGALKSQLRNKLVSELRQEAIEHVEQTDQSKAESAPEESLFQKASHSVVADHLRRCKLDYSLSVFLPECGLPDNQLLLTGDLLKLLNISPQSRLYHKLVSQNNSYDNKGFLWHLLSDVALACGHASHDIAVQTDATRLPSASNIEEQFRQLDSHYSVLGDNHKQKWMAVEERILSYQRKLEERSRHDLQLEVARFKENELARMHLEEKEKSQQQLDRIRKEMEISYQAKAEMLLNRERHATERLQKEQQIAEKETYNQRQSILEQIEAVRQRDTIHRRTDEVNQREKQLHDEKIKTKEQMVKKREEDVRKSEIEYNQKLHDEMKRYKLEHDAKVLDKMTDLEHREMRVRENEHRLDDELHGIQQIKDELREKRCQYSKIEMEFIKTRHDLMTAQSEVEIFQGKAREMVDYQIVKEENTLFKREVDVHKMRIAELSRDSMAERQKNEDLLREMAGQASKPTPEVYLMQKEVERMRNELNQERAIMAHQKQTMESRFLTEVGRNQELLRKFEEQTLQLESMNREFRDLRQQLGQTKTALTNEVYRKPNTTGLNRSASPCDLVGGSIDPLLIRQAAEPELLLSASHGPISDILNQHKDYGVTLSHSEDYSYSMDLVEDTKKRLRNLEHEAENLDHHYRNFQYRMTAVHTDLDDPVPASSVKPTTSTTAVLSAAHTPKHRNTTPNVLSSTPHHQRLDPLKDTSSHELLAITDDSLINNSVSTVQSSPPADETQQSQYGKALDKAASVYQSGVARVVSAPVVTSSEANLHTKPGEETVMAAASVPPKSYVPPAEMSLDEAWKQAGDESMKLQELEATQVEEHRRMEERDQWEGEHKSFEELQGNEAEKVPNTDSSTPEDQASGRQQEPGIDPTMQKYMEIVQKQKEVEKKVAKTTIDTWSKGKKDKTPSASEDLSRADDGSVAELSDHDFW